MQTPDERVKLVYAVKLYLDENPGHKLSPGLPADAVIRWQEETHGRSRAGREKAVISINGFCKSYKKKLAVNNVDLSVQRGEIYGLIGPDGAGKSSLMKAIAGVLSFEKDHWKFWGLMLFPKPRQKR